MPKRTVKFIIIIVILSFSILSGVFLLGQSKEKFPPETTQNLGFSYLPITPGLSAYYGLGLESGALVTDVVPDSPASKAGIVAGDVITSFNGKKIEPEVPLLSLMRECMAGNVVTVEIWRNKVPITKEFVHTDR